MVSAKSNKSIKTLQENDERLRTFIAASYDIVYVMSPNWSKMTELVGKGFLGDTVIEDHQWLKKYILPEDHAYIFDMIKNCIQEEKVFELEHRAYKGDGSVCWLSSRAVPIFDDKGEIKEWFGAAKDISSQKRAEQELCRSRERFKSIFFNNMIPMAVCKRDGIIVDANDALLELIGYTREDLNNRLIDWTVLTPTAYVKEDAQALVEIDKKGFCAPFEKQYRHKNGYLIPIIVGAGRFDPLLQENILFIVDPTERKQLEQSLKEREERLSYLLELSDALRFIQDPKEVRLTACRILGEYLGANRVVFGEVTDEQDIVITHDYASGVSSMDTKFDVLNRSQFIRESYHSGKPLVINDVFLDPRLSGEDRDAYESMEIAAIVSIGLIKEGKWVATFGVHYHKPRNWTALEVELMEDTAFRIWETLERAKAIEALRISEAKFRTLANAVPAIIMQSDPQGRNLFINKYGLDFAGLSAKDVHGMGWQMIIHPDERDVMVSEYLIALSEQRPWHNLSRSRRFDGEWRWLDHYSEPLFDSKRTYLGHVSVSVDITERIDMENDLLKSERMAQALVKDLKESDRNKNEFINILSHELRNPLSTISGGMQLLDIVKDSEKISTIKETIKRQVNHLCKLVDDLLELTRISQNKIVLKKETVILNQLIRDVIADFSLAYAQKEVSLEVKMTPEIIQLSADPVRITQIIGNILHNALKFTPPNGLVQVTLESREQQAIIEVDDNGRGIGPKLLPVLFKPFMQDNDSLNKNNNGLGLGLAIVKNIVDLHGGSVNAKSPGVNLGSTFTVMLPLKQKP